MDASNGFKQPEKTQKRPFSGIKKASRPIGTSGYSYVFDSDFCWMRSHGNASSSRGQIEGLIRGAARCKQFALFELFIGNQLNRLAEQFKVVEFDERLVGQRSQFGDV